VSDTVTCPACGAVQRDLWDHDWSRHEDIVTSCDSCGKDYMLSRHVSVSYEASKLVNREDASKVAPR
jgi:hypothetical protein